jgi:hypothetical protein
MDEQEKTNAQHLAAMGLSEIKLGSSYTSSASNQLRCDIMQGDYRCARTKGHNGNHARGGVIWAQAEVEEPDRSAPLSMAERAALIDLVVKVFHPVPVATVEIAVDGILAWIGTNR